MATALSDRSTIIIDSGQSPWDVFDEKARARIPVEGGLNVGGAPKQSGTVPGQTGN